MTASIALGTSRSRIRFGAACALVAALALGGCTTPKYPPAPHDAVFSTFCLWGQAIAFPAPIPENAPQYAWRAVRTERWKYVEIEGGQSLLFDRMNDPHENHNLAQLAQHAEICKQLKALLYRDFNWAAAHQQLAADRARLPQFKSGLRPSTPNQYRLADGRVFDAEGDLYGARWLRLPDDTSGGIIPQQFG